MINVILGTAGVLAGFFFGCWLIVQALDGYRLRGPYTVAAFIYWSVALGGLFYVIGQQAASGPCVTWETQMHYNATLKMMMPARVCTLRGEWVNP